jgi:hypothetical protein
MIDPTLLLFLIAVVVVLATSLLKLPWFGEKVKVAIATVISVVGAAVHVWLTGDFEAFDLVATSLQVYGGSQLIYLFIMNDTKFDDKLERVGVSPSYDTDA